MKRVVRTPDFPIVETRLGKLHGFKQDDVYHFHGIRYGTADRFEMPVMEQPWEGIRDAKSYGYICPLLPENRQAQTSVTHDPAEEANPMAQPFGSFEMPHVYWPMSEQCLYLNLWTKHLDSEARRPVMVWIHGGGFSAGSSIELPGYDGHNLADYADVVIVNLNHRLNCIGFLDLSEFGEAYQNSGSLGLADIVLALQWVKDNISFFGGDPDNITVAGQSGGGGKVTMLMQMPAADGLYHKVISQSGAIMRENRNTLEEEQEHWRTLARKTVEILGLNQDTIDEIRTIPYETLADAASEAGKTLGREGGLMLFQPSPVQGLYEGPCHLAGFRRETAHIPCMAGTVLGEFSFMHYLGDKRRYSQEEKLSILRETFGEDTDRILELFIRNYPDKDILYSLSVDTLFRPGTVEFLDARINYLEQESPDTPCWNYLMSFIIPYLGGIVPFHCADISYVFRNVESELLLCAGYEYASELQDRISEAWIAFMSTGNPSTSKLAWKPYRTREKARMIIDEKCFVTMEDDRELLELIRKHGPFASGT